ncbi:MAG: NAD(P)-dependent oxidoreductase [Actinomycetota bacterium]
MTSVIGANEGNRTVLVTGGSGFLGQHLIPRLLTDGWKVVNVDLVAPSTPNHENLRNIIGDLRDHSVRESCFTESVDAVVHLAASISVIHSATEPGSYFVNNVLVTQELLELSRVHQVPQFVFASSVATVGEVGGTLITPDTPLRPLSPYGASKAAAEMLVTAYGNAYEMRTVNIRFTNIYGPGLGKKDSLISRLMKGAIGGPRLKIYGDGSQSRDYLYCDDAIAAVLVALATDISRTFIAGSGVSSTVLQTIDSVAGVTGAAPQSELAPANRLQMSHVVIDPTYAAHIGFTPKWSFHEGLVNTWQSFKL